MSVIKPTSAAEHHHDRAGREPAVIQGDVIVLFLLIGVCIWIWHAAFRRAPELEAPRGFMQRQLDACPFTIRQINKTTYLIRELDRFVSLATLSRVVTTHTPRTRTHTSTSRNKPKSSQMAAQQVSSSSTTRAAAHRPPANSPAPANGTSGPSSTTTSTPHPPSPTSSSSPTATTTTSSASTPFSAPLT